jgi:phosphonate transport system substrate-binding protein
LLAVVMLLGSLVMSLGALDSAGQPGNDPTMRFGISPAIIAEANPRDVVAATTLWAKGLVAQIGYWKTASVVIFKDVNDAVDSINTGRTELAALSTMEFLAVESKLQANPGLVYQQAKESMIEFVVLVRPDITSVAQLPGKRLAISLGAGDWDMSGIWLDVLLGEAGLPRRQTTFSTVKIVTKSSQALMALFFKQVDVAVGTRAAFATAVELNPQLGKELRILATSPALLPALVCVKNTMNPDLKRRYTTSAAHLHELPQYNQAFIVMQVTKISTFNPRDLDTARALLARRDALDKKAQAR